MSTPKPFSVFIEALRYGNIESPKTLEDNTTPTTPLTTISPWYKRISHSTGIINILDKMNHPSTPPHTRLQLFEEAVDKLEKGVVARRAQPAEPGKNPGRPAHHVLASFLFETKKFSDLSSISQKIYQDSTIQQQWQRSVFLEKSAIALEQQGTETPELLALALKLWVQSVQTRRDIEETDKKGRFIPRSTLYAALSNGHINVSRLLERSGKQKEATTLLKQAIKILQRGPDNGRDYESIATCMHKIGTILASQPEKQAESAIYLQNAIDMRRRLSASQSHELVAQGSSH